MEPSRERERAQLNRRRARPSSLEDALHAQEHRDLLLEMPVLGLDVDVPHAGSRLVE